MRFNIITGSKRYSLFPILSGLIEPSLRKFRISLLNGLFSPVGIGRSIPSLRTVLESFLPHTAQQPTLLVSRFDLPYLMKSNKIPHGSISFFGLTKRSQLHEFQTEIWMNNPFHRVLSFFPPSEE